MPIDDPHKPLPMIGIKIDLLTLPGWWRKFRQWIKKTKARKANT